MTFTQMLKKIVSNDETILDSSQAQKNTGLVLRGL